MQTKEKYDTLSTQKKKKNSHNVSLFSFRDIDKVDATMDDIRDQMDVANEISEAISRPVGMGEDLDEVKKRGFTTPFL